MKAAPAARDILEAVETLKTLNTDNTRKVPNDAPIGFVKKRWESLVFTDDGVDRRFYELCTLAELKNALRSGDIWVQGSRQFRDFDEYLLPARRILRRSGRLALLPLAVVTDCDPYLQDRLLLLEQQIGSRQPLGQGRCIARRHHHRLRPENHAADQFRARGRGAADAAGLRVCCHTSRSRNC